MCLLVIHPELDITISSYIKEKVAKRRVMYAERLVIHERDIKNSAKAV
jgi:hypothetical protein